MKLLGVLEGILFVDKMIPGTMEYTEPEKE